MSAKKLAAQKRRLAIAHHEAGHAVIARYFGVGVRYVELTLDDPECQGRCVQFKPRRKPMKLDEDELLLYVEHELCIYFAGQLAEARFLGRMPSRFAHQADMIDAGRLASRVCRSDAELKHFYFWLFERTRRLVLVAWPTICHVGEALAETGRLSGDELAVLMRASLTRHR